MDIAGEMAGKLSNLSLCDKAAISLERVESEYILDIDSQNCSTIGKSAKIAAISSKFSVRLYSRHSLANISQVKAHEKPLTGVRFSPSDSNIFYTSSLDGSIKSWDMRDLEKPSQTFTGYEKTKNVFCSFDLDCRGRILCAGTEGNKEGENHLIFWDVRSSDKLGVYEDAHSGDITQVKFHPTNGDKMITCATDGLVNLYDLTKEEEDDALLTSFNTESSAGTIGWCGENKENVYCLSDIQTFHIWESETDEFETLTTIPDLRENYSGSKKFDYLVDCFQPHDSKRPLLLTGSNSGAAQLWTVKGNDLKFLTSLSGGHKTVIRCATWDDELANLVTGGEDSMLCSWGSGGKMSTQASESKSGAKDLVQRKQKHQKNKTKFKKKKP